MADERAQLVDSEVAEAPTLRQRKLMLALNAPNLIPFIIGAALPCRADIRLKVQLVLFGIINLTQAYLRFYYAIPTAIGKKLVKPGHPTPCHITLHHCLNLCLAIVTFWGMSLVYSKDVNKWWHGDGGDCNPNVFHCAFISVTIVGTIYVAVIIFLLYKCNTRRSASS